MTKIYLPSSTAAPWSKRQTATKPLPVSKQSDRVFAKGRGQAEKRDTNPLPPDTAIRIKKTVYIEISDGISNNDLISNKIHPFYSQGKWIQASRLKKATPCFPAAQNRRFKTLRFKQQPLKAYNLTVADWHTYFVKGSQAKRKGFGF